MGIHIRNLLLSLKWLFWIGAITVWVCASTTTDIAGQGPLQRNWVIGKLDREHRFVQTFIAEHDTLVGIRLLLFTNPTNQNDAIIVHLKPADGLGPDFATAQLPIRNLSPQGMTTFPFQPLTFASQDIIPLRIELEAPTLPVQEGITVIAGPDTYEHGEVSLNETTFHSADLAFQPVYRIRWFDRILPLSRMAYDKPGLLGWPPLYALLAYSYCYILVIVLVKVQRVFHTLVDAL